LERKYPPLAPYGPRHFPRWFWFSDVVIAFAMFSIVYSLFLTTNAWTLPLETVTISLDPLMLPIYTVYSTVRTFAAYALILVFSLIFGYVAAHSRPAERILEPLVYVLQSLPVLSFLPLVMFTFVFLLPDSRLGLEMGSIVLMFTTQAANVAIAFHNSLKTVPSALRDYSKVYRLSAWQRFTKIELPFAAIPLIWNSVLSVAGCWFFLMACELFTLIDRRITLPGVGSYLALAADSGDMTAVLWGLGALVFIIVLTDLLIWRPLIIWSSKFKYEYVTHEVPDRSSVIDFVAKSRITRILVALGKGVDSIPFPDLRRSPSRASSLRPMPRNMKAVFAGISLLALSYIFYLLASILIRLPLEMWFEVLWGTLSTIARVETALLLALAWTLPVGIKIGTNPRITKSIQPVLQVIASIPATALFPVILLAIIEGGGGLNIASIILMLLGMQWYLLFNIIAGASSIPEDLLEASKLAGLRGFRLWRTVILPAIVPYVITGSITAQGSAFNASVVSEYIHFSGQVLSTSGLGALIALATDTGNLPLLVASSIAISATVVTLNNFLWKRLYNFCKDRYSL